MSLDNIKALKLKHPLIVAPMAGGPSSVEFVSASSNVGVLGSVGAAYLTANEIENFVIEVRRRTSYPIAINLFIPQNLQPIQEAQFQRAVEATQNYRKELGLPKPVLQPPYEENFDQQFETVLKLKPEVFSFVFGLLKKEYVDAAKAQKIFLIGTATTLEEALALQESGIDAITIQGFEAGGHRGMFDAKSADSEILLFDLLQQCCAKIKIPLIAAGGIMTKADIVKALSKGAQAVQMGTAFLACEEAGTSNPYRKALQSSQRKTKTTRAFSGRFARGIENRFMCDMDQIPEVILPFPAQNKFTRDLRVASTKANSSDFLSLWAGTGQGSLWTGSVAELVEELFLKN